MRSHAHHLFSHHSPYFDRIESYCLLYGYVIASPTYYIMAMPCRSTDTLEQILDISGHLCRMTPDHDAVHIWCAAGDMRAMLTHLEAFPHIRYLSFQRFGRTHKHHILDTHGLKTKIAATSPATRHGEQCRHRRPGR